MPYTLKWASPSDPGADYVLSDTVLDEMLQMALDSQLLGLEQGADLCSKDGHTVDKLGITCTGDACSVAISDCKATNHLGNFHTHPYKQKTSFHPSAPSWGDIYAMLWKAKYTGDPRARIACRVGFDPQIRELRCDHIKDIPSDSAMKDVSIVWQRNRHLLGEDFPEFGRYIDEPIIEPWGDNPKLADQKSKANKGFISTGCDYHAVRIGSMREEMLMAEQKNTPTGLSCDELAYYEAKGRRALRRLDDRMEPVRSDENAHLRMPLANCRDARSKAMSFIFGMEDRALAAGCPASLPNEDRELADAIGCYETLRDVRSANKIVQTAQAFGPPLSAWSLNFYLDQAHGLRSIAKEVISAHSCGPEGPTWAQACCAAFEEAERLIENITAQQAKVPVNNHGNP